MTFILPLTKACSKVPSSRDGIALMPTSHPTSRSHPRPGRFWGLLGNIGNHFTADPGSFMHRVTQCCACLARPPEKPIVYTDRDQYKFKFKGIPISTFQEIGI